MSYIVLTYIEPGNYIPQHDPSFVHETFDSAMTEVEHDKVYGKDIAIWKLDSVLRKDSEWQQST